MSNEQTAPPTESNPTVSLPLNYRVQPKSTNYSVVSARQPGILERLFGNGETKRHIAALEHDTHITIETDHREDCATEIAVHTVHCILSGSARMEAGVAAYSHSHLAQAVAPDALNIGLQMLMDDVPAVGRAGIERLTSGRR